MLLLEHLFVSYPQIAQLKRLVIISSVPSAWSVLSLSVSLSASTSHAQQVLKQILRKFTQKSVVMASDSDFLVLNLASAYVCTLYMSYTPEFCTVDGPSDAATQLSIDIIFLWFLITRYLPVLFNVVIRTRPAGRRAAALRRYGRPQQPLAEPALVGQQPGHAPHLLHDII